MKVVFSHPTGNQNVRAVLSSLFRTNTLAEFNTTIAINPSNTFIQLLSADIRNNWMRRTYPVPATFINNYPLLELARLFLPKIGLKKITEHEFGWASIDAVYKNLDKIVSRRLPDLALKNKATAVYAYEDGALATFKKAKQLGLKCIYDLPIAYWETGRKLMTEEAERLPHWAETLAGGILDSKEKLERKTQELQLADVVIGPGKFVIDSLPAWAKEKEVLMASFGSPEVKETYIKGEIKKSKVNRPLRVLFAGSMSQRKGLGDLFAAMKILNRPDVELVVMGSLISSMKFYKSQYADFTYEAGRRNEAVLALMRSCDLLCLPSIVEGRALVMQEAMSQGLPLIITPNTGGADLIIEGQTGFLVPIRTPAAIAEKLEWFAENRSAIPEMGRNAAQYAKNYTWENYGATIVESLADTES